MKNFTSIELLAPAKNAEFGIAAINHGADAVYIGAPRFGARAAVSNTIDEIASLIKHAHLFRAKVYATLNTILFDDELEDAREIIWSLYNEGVDGLIIQDMGLLEMTLPPVPLIASTQTHNASVESVSFLENIGFQRVILARELSLSEIGEIRKHTTVELESFVHGALCVSFSGRCYLSQAVCNRSGNRGVCAQPCRSSYDLVDNDGNILVHDKHLLSLKDFNLLSHIEALMDAGISSFKIEGRLKDLSYLKNVTASYRNEIDRILEEKPNYAKSSSGKSTFSFTPDLAKSFNRGFTKYNIEGRKEKSGSFLTQKSLGKKVGEITHISRDWFILTGDALANGDGICFFNENDDLTGTLIGRVEGERAYPNNMEGLRVGLEIYRNHDHLFEKQLQSETCQRKIKVALSLKEWEQGLILEATDEDGISATVSIDIIKNLAEKVDRAREQTIAQLSKLGDTVFVAGEISINTAQVYFVPASILNQLRRDVVQALIDNRLKSYKVPQVPFVPNDFPYFETNLTYSANVSNRLARQFYTRHGVENIEPAFELIPHYTNKEVMTTKYCIRYQMDACPKYQKSGKKFDEPLFLKDSKHVYRLSFDCKQCVMNVIFED